jgi:hypothetical protein
VTTAGTVSVNLAPHSPQNAESDVFEAPHAGQPLAKRAPQSLQNLRPASLSLSQLAQRKRGLLNGF